MLTKLVSLFAAVAASFLFVSGPSPDTSSPRAETLSVDAMHSCINFRVKHMDTSYFYGRFNKIGGELVIDEKVGSVSIEIDADSIDTNSKGRDEHLTGKDFLDAAQFPKITFVAKKLAKKGSDWEAAGDMTMHGVTKPLTVLIKATGSTDNPRSGGKVYGFETEFSFKRTDFAVGATTPAKALGDEIKVMLAIEAGPKK